MREETLRALVPKLSLAYFAKNATILSAQTGPVEELHIVQRGLVGRRPNDTQADTDRTLGPGELFPVGALSAGGTTTKIFHALQDTFCYLLSRDDFLALRQESPEFERYCTQAITETLKQSLESLYSQYSQRATEQQTLDALARRTRAARAGLLPRDRDAARGRADDGGREGAHDHRRRTAGARPVGMFTLVDLLKRIVLPERPLATLVADVMSAPIVTLPGSATAYEAMHVMAERGIRQIVAVDKGRPLGVINERDLFALQRVSMRDVNEGLHAAESIEELKRAAEDIRRLTQNLLAQGVGAEPLTRTISSLNDALTRRAIDIVRRQHALDGIDWCWLALGSEGRGEQTFATDQDNAILFAPPDEATTPALRERLLAIRPRGQRRARHARLSALHGQRDGGQPGSLPVDGRVEGEVPHVDPRAHAARAAQREHRVRLPAHLR